MRMHYCCSSSQDTYLLETEIYSPWTGLLPAMFELFATSYQNIIYKRIRLPDY